jgi:hypothetical protein
MKVEGKSLYCWARHGCFAVEPLLFNCFPGGRGGWNCKIEICPNPNPLGLRLGVLFLADGDLVPRYPVWI